MAKSYPSDQEIWELAREHGLDPYPVHFEALPASVLYEFAAYLIPGRMSHWSYGKAYHAMKTRYDYGLNKLYEMVINSNPAYAFLLESNSDLENTFVRSHVMGHVDFFHHNQCFWHTSPDMLERVAHHADRVRQYEFQYGRERVEGLLDAALAVEEHVRPPSMSIKLPPRARPKVLRSRVDDYGSLVPRAEQRVDRVREVRQPIETDLLGFVATNGRHLHDWERDIIEMVRDEMIYFWPQIRTKIMNEGWATFWHATLMREIAMDDEDYLDFARLHASVIAPLTYQINPYSVGYHIFRDLDARMGRSAIFLARDVDDDVSFIRNYLTEDLVRELNMFVYGARQDDVVVKSRSWTEVRDRLASDLVHGGIPVIDVDDGDFNRRGELYLIHRHEGIDLDMPYAEKALQSVHRLWGRPVHLETVSDNRRVVLTYDGKVSTKIIL